MKGDQARTHFNQHCRNQAALIGQYIQQAAALDDWPALRQELTLSLTGQPHFLLALPLLTCQSAGGAPEKALPVAAAWLSFHHGAHLLDKDCGQERRKSANADLAAGLIFAGFELVKAIPDSAARLKILDLFSANGLHSARGKGMFQAVQDAPETADARLERYWQAVILKSGSIFSAGAAAGAATATDRQDVLDALGEFGTCLGVILQVIDDCRDDRRDRIERPALPGLPALLADQLGPAHEKALPEVLSQILIDWQRRAVEALSRLPDTEEVELLKQIPGYILNRRMD